MYGQLLNSHHMKDCCVEQRSTSAFTENNIWLEQKTIINTSYFNKELKSLVLLLKFLEEADGFSVVAAELPIDLLHVLSTLLRELHTHTHT